MSRPINALIDLSALKHNLSVVRRYAKCARVMAVIKADAYGHGLLRAAEAFSSADGFAILEIDAAIHLREAGYQHTILLIEGFFSKSELELFERYQLSAVIHNSKQLQMLSAYKLSGKLNVFLKLNTGMNRLGFTPEQFLKALETLQSNSAIDQITLMTHFACADNRNDRKEVIEQLQCFNSVVTNYDLPCSLANSAATLQYPETHADWVRPGIMLYGASPFSDISASELDLRPSMTFTSEIIAVQNLNAGDTVGYGQTFCAKQIMRVGIVAGGYADGYPRHAPTGTPVLVNGVRTRIIGRVSMDMLHVDLSKVANAGIGSPVVFWGKGMPVEEVAQAAGTISYDLLCSLTQRVKIKT
ncbi:MAG: alanine racemase [Nitrosomonadaceae bacterium]|nr:alanine racemase [Nitrosomonadaceae bacterium]|tara:strand:- start:911 stop:1984 length:1074 start_codon:yes stop_codon:yes gene_type:complete